MGHILGYIGQKHVFPLATLQTKEGPAAEIQNTNKDRGVKPIATMPVPLIDP